MLSVADRLASRLEPTENGCLVYTGCRQDHGYGRIGLGGRGGRVVYTHRLAYELEHGPIPDGLLVCHHCDNPPCCNPDHLFLGGKSENAKDMFVKGYVRQRDAKGKFACWR